MSMMQYKRRDDTGIHNGIRKGCRGVILTGMIAWGFLGYPGFNTYAYDVMPQCDSIEAPLSADMLSVYETADGALSEEAYRQLEQGNVIHISNTTSTDGSSVNMVTSNFTAQYNKNTKILTLTGDSSKDCVLGYLTYMGQNKYGIFGDLSEIKASGFDTIGYYGLSPYYYNAKKVTATAGVIGKQAFYSSSFKASEYTVVLNGVEKIESKAFHFGSVPRLSGKISISPGTYQIAEDAFQSPCTIVATGNDAYKVDTGSNCFYEVSTGKALAYQSGMSTPEDFIPGQQIKELALSFRATLPESVSQIDLSQSQITKVGEFNKLNSLQTLTFPNRSWEIQGDGRYSISDYYSQNPSLVSVNNFEYCSNFEKCTSLFAADEKLKTITLPKGTREIPYYTFGGCRELESVQGDLSSVVTVGMYAFQNTEKLQTISLPNVKYIKDNAFFDSGLEEISFENAMEIGDGAFFHCPGMNHVYLPQATLIGRNVFSQIEINETEAIPIYQDSPNRNKITLNWDIGSLAEKTQMSANTTYLNLVHPGALSAESEMILGKGIRFLYQNDEKQKVYNKNNEQILSSYFVKYYDTQSEAFISGEMQVAQKVLYLKPATYIQAEYKIKGIDTGYEYKKLMEPLSYLPTTDLMIQKSYSGYEEIVWYTDENLTKPYHYREDCYPGSEVTLYAEKKPLVYQVEYELNGGEQNDENPDTYDYDHPLALANPTRFGYDFMGWFAEEDFSGEILHLLTKGDAFLYASWRDNHKDCYIKDERAATCTTEGYSGTTVCNVCDRQVSGNSLPIDANAHKKSQQKRGVKAPDYKEDGYTGDEYCLLCDEVLVKGEVIPKLICQHPKFTMEIIREATVLETGLMRYACLTKGCDYTYDEIIEVKECNHEKVRYVNEKPSSCLEEGFSGDVFCEFCLKQIQTGERIPKLNTHADLLLRDVVSQNSCLVPGYTGDRYCSVCDTLIEKGQEIPAGGHRYVSEITKQASILEEGEITYTCEKCMDQYTEVIPVVKEDCTHKNAERRNARSASCQKDGEGYSGDIFCLDCGQLLELGEVLARLSEHADIQIIGAVSESCAAPGYTGDVYCMVCHELLSEGLMIPANEQLHEWKDLRVISQSTSTQEGQKAVFCQGCGQIEVVALPLAKPSKQPDQQPSVEPSGDINSGNASQEGMPSTVPSKAPAVIPSDSQDFLLHTQVVISSLLYQIVSKDEAQCMGLSKSKSSVSIPAEITVAGRKFKVTSIAKGAFRNSGVKSVTLNKNIKVIGSKAFYGCKKLGKVNMKKAKSVKKIGSKAFGNTRSITFTLPKAKAKAYQKLLKNKTAKPVFKIK